jgi:hypothetical protein
MPSINTSIPDASDSKFDVDSGDAPDPVAIHDAIFIVASSIGLGHFVMSDSSFGVGA